MQKSNKVYIIGAGPVGCTLSMFLSKHEIEHVLIDKAVFPRDKVCGDGLTIEVMKVLKEINPDLLEEFKQLDFLKPSKGFAFFTPKGKQYDYFVSDEGHLCSYFYVGKRLDFDNWMVEKCSSNYAEILLGHELKEIRREDGGVVLEIKKPSGELEEHYAKLVVGCDGERSIVKKKLHPEGIKKDREHYVGALRQYYTGLQPLKDYNPLEFYAVDQNKNAYFWIFHCPNGVANVGIGASSKDLSELKINLRDDLQNMITKHKALKERFKNAEPLEKPKGWGIPLNSNRIDYYGDNYLVIGDAGSMAEPLTGKGIGVGMYAAMAAIPTIVRVLEEDDYSAENLKTYQELIAQKLYKEWDRLLKYQNMFSKRLIFNTFMWATNLPIINKKICKNLEKTYSTFVANKTKF